MRYHYGASHDEPVRVRRRFLFLWLGIAVGLFVGTYAMLCAFARRPLSPTEFWIFAAAVVRATPAHLRGSSPLETFRLGGAAFRSPVESVTLSTEGQPFSVPLPPRTVRMGHPLQPQRFVTFATGAELGDYLRSTLRRAGWSYREQFGSVHILDRGRLVLSVQSTFYLGTRVGELRISAHSRPRRAASAGPDDAGEVTR
jgi:hypothetical protein